MNDLTTIILSFKTIFKAIKTVVCHNNLKTDGTIVYRFSKSYVTAMRMNELYRAISDIMAGLVDYNLVGCDPSIVGNSIYTGYAQTMNVWHGPITLWYSYANNTVVVFKPSEDKAEYNIQVMLVDPGHALYPYYAQLAGQDC